jgi:SIR2-like domain
VPGSFEETRWEALIDSINAGQCTPFLGAGVSRPVLPTGGQLASALASEFRYPLVDVSNLPRVGQYLATTRDPLFPKRRVAKRIVKQEGQPPNFLDPRDPHGVLASLDLPIYLTTNWDSFMTMALRARRREVTQEVSRWNEDVLHEAGAFDAISPSPERPLVYHLHGHAGMLSSMVLTEDDYIDFVAKLARDLEAVVPPTVQEALSFHSLLFVGYSLTDWNFHVLLRLLMGSLATRKPQHLHVSVQIPNKDLIAEECEDDAKQFIAGYLETSNVRIHWGEAEPFLWELRDRCRRSDADG